MVRYFLFGLLLLAGCKSPAPESTLSRGPSLDANIYLLSEDREQPQSAPLAMLQELGFYRSLKKDILPAGIYSNPDAPAVADFIRSAKKSVDIEIYEIEDRDVRSAIRWALKNGRRVRLIKDPKTVAQTCNPFFDEKLAKENPKVYGPASRQNTPPCRDLTELRDEIRSVKGNAFVPFNKQNLCGKKPGSDKCFQHGKLVIIDNQQALISTGNFNSSSLCNLSVRPPPKKCNRDFSYITNDPEAVAGLLEIFENDLKQQRYDLLAILKRGNLAKKITVSPYSYEPLVEFINSAETSVQIQNQYIRDIDFAAALIDLKKRKPHLKIDVMLSDVCYYGSITETQRYMNNRAFSAFEDVKINTKMFPKTRAIRNRPGYLHSKAIVIDGTRAWIGSVNFSSTSLNENREFGVFFKNPLRVAAFAQFMQADFDDPNNKTWQDSVLKCGEKRKKGAASRVDEDDDDENE